MNQAVRSRGFSGAMRGTLLQLVLVVLAPLLVVQIGIYVAWCYTRWSDQEAATLDTAREAASTFDAFVRDVCGQESAIGAALTGPHPYSTDGTNDFLRTAGQHYPSVQFWSWTNPDGKVIASSHPKAIGLNFGDQAYFKKIVRDRSWAVSDLVIDRVTGTHTFVIATPIYDQERTLVGAVIATTNAADLGERAVALYHTVGEAVALFDPQGVLVYNSQPHRTIFQDWRSRDSLLAKALDKGEPQVGVALIAGDGETAEKCFVARVPVRGMGWVAGSRRPVAQAMASVYTGLWVAGGLNLLVVVGSCGWAWRTSGAIIHELRDLQSHAQAIGRGDFGHVAESAGVLELVELAIAFNQMGTAIRAAQESRDAANAALEQRVRERTAQLATTVERLEKSEQEVRSASLYARGLLEASLDPFVTISIDGKIADVNEATEAVTGVPREKLIGSDFSDYFTEPDLARDGYRRVLTESMILDYPLTIRHVSGRMTDVLYNAVVYKNEAGEVQGIFAAARDVTERRRIERELDKYRAHLEELVQQRTEELETANKSLQRTADQLTRSNQELEQFAYIASHDLQEPLRVVTGYVQLIERKYKSHLDADTDQFIYYIVDGVTRMQQLITDLLNYSRVGTRGVPFRTVSVQTVIDRVLANLNKVVEESGATVTCDSLPSVHGDETQLVQVFQNLIANGIKFRGDRPPDIHISAHRDGSHWEFAVRDNGIGIDREYWEQIFVIFQRLHTRQKYAGTGIGLAICKRIVERHGGRIWLDSKPGEGTTFYFTLS